MFVLRCIVSIVLMQQADSETWIEVFIVVGRRRYIQRGLVRL
jgi:hypothetical protein